MSIIIPSQKLIVKYFFYKYLSGMWRLNQRGLAIPGDNVRGWPRIRMPGELLWAAYAPVGAKGNGDDEIVYRHE